MGSTYNGNPSARTRLVAGAAVVVALALAFLVGLNWPRPALRCSVPPAPAATVSAVPQPSFTPVFGTLPPATPSPASSFGEGTGKG